MIQCVITHFQVLYVTVTAPYIFMLVLLVRGLTLPGSMSGLKYYLSPDLERLTDIQVSERSQNMEPSKLSDTSKKEPHQRSRVPNQAPGTASQ